MSFRYRSAHPSGARIETGNSNGARGAALDRSAHPSGARIETNADLTKKFADSVIAPLTRAERGLKREIPNGCACVRIAPLTRAERGLKPVYMPRGYFADNRSAHPSGARIETAYSHSLFLDSVIAPLTRAERGLKLH